MPDQAFAAPGSCDGVLLLKHLPVLMKDI